MKLTIGQKYDVKTIVCTGWTDKEGNENPDVTGYNFTDYFKDGSHIKSELMAWVNDCNSGIRPTECVDSENKLCEAKKYELGNYNCSDEEQKQKAIAAIADYSGDGTYLGPDEYGIEPVCRIDYGDLIDYRTGNLIRPATEDEWRESREAEKSNIGGGTGVIGVEIDGEDKSVWVEGGPELEVK